MKTCSVWETIPSVNQEWLVNFFLVRIFFSLPTDPEKSWKVTGNDNIILSRLIFWIWKKGRGRKWPELGGGDFAPPSPACRHPCHTSLASYNMIWYVLVWWIGVHCPCNVRCVPCLTVSNNNRGPSKVVTVSTDFLTWASCLFWSQ